MERRPGRGGEAVRGAAVRYPGVVVPHEPETSRAIYHLHVVRVPDREGLGEHLKSLGVSTGLHCPVSVHLQKCYTDRGYVPGSLPVTERVAGNILSLPMLPTLSAGQQERVALPLGTFAG